KYKAVVFLSTTGDVLDQYQQSVFKRFIQAGGGYMGIHAAADTEYEWYWYGKLVGAYFKSHPKIQDAKFKKVKSDELVEGLPDDWMRKDELYNYKKISKDINVLYTLDETTYEGGENGDNHPIVWYHEFDGGRSFYTGLGHTKESYVDPQYLDHIWMGLDYVIGDSKLDYTKATTKLAPEENRFNKVVLASYFDEPTEMDILPDGRIIFLERKGAVKLYDPKADSIALINTFNVNTKFEDGMLGLAHDPDFAKNNWLYIYYSTPSKSANILSRFTLDGSKIDMASEKEMLEVATQRESCCHTGGSITFGPDNNLYVSTGDNTSPFESDGFSPSDETPGRSPFDAQKSSSNTNDLRGKILRIHPEADGTYSIPEGNLFPKGEEKTRGEIYVMGNRNPYRISIDQKTGFLYWGEVGPDAGEDKETRGIRGYDEVNQAQKPGFFGWPYFVGGNYAYNEYDFENKTSAPKHDALKPINNSPNNTGKLELPPVSPPFIWYPYAASPDFPLMKEGSRNAMAGPVYYSEKYKGQSDAFPDYFDGKLIIYDWMRNWMRLVSMDQNGKITDIDPFMEGVQFNNIIDMAFGPDGKLYTLEYGTRWFASNPDSRLSRIDFNRGNRAPLPKLTADKTVGALPLVVNISAAGTIDPDGDAITYQLEANNQTLTSADGIFNVTFDKAGIYRPKLTVKDSNGSSSSADITIVAGNEPPVVSLNLTTGNSQFYLAGGSVSYSASATDKEDGSSSDGSIPAHRVLVTVDYLPQGYDMTKIAQGHQRAELPGKLLIAESDCKSCHLIDKKSAGPAYRDVALKYKSDVKAIEKLSDKILKGGAGVWGETPMAAHPQVSKEDAMAMVEYILSLSDVKDSKGLPLKGTAKFEPAPKEGITPTSAYIITAMYDDNGALGMPSISASQTSALRAPVLNGADVVEFKGGTSKRSAGPNIVVDNVKHNSSVRYQDIDLTGVDKLQFTIAEIANVSKGGEIEVYLDSPTGKKLGKVSFDKSPKIELRAGITARSTSITIEPLSGKHTFVLVFKNEKAGNDNLFMLSRITLEK
ncbi:MAG TPA: ThuA domain-containing protein, partial [Flavobacteriales bacterium]|nr:ThuA domain-containing protein [Flavobacteriales bacterium]